MYIVLSDLSIIVMIFINRIVIMVDISDEYVGELLIVVIDSERGNEVLILRSIIYDDKCYSLIS